MRDTLRYQEIGSSRKYQQPEPKPAIFIIEIKGKQCHVMIRANVCFLSDL